MLAALNYFRNDDISNARTFVLDSVDLVADSRNQDSAIFIVPT
jgi:hypothetical protein